MTTRKLLRLPSVGEWIDVHTHELYPSLDNGQPDYDIKFPNRLSDVLDNSEWKKLLSLEDAKRLNRNLVFEKGGEDE